jgi:riboflavin kinase
MSSSKYKDKIKMHMLVTLIELLLRGARSNYVNITTTELANSIGKSQQAASKHLLELESNGYIKRMRYGQGFSIKVTEKGYREVYNLFMKLKAVIEPIKVIELVGTVVKGMGEGSYYMSLNGYRLQFISRLGFDPYPGTLNIKLDKMYIDAKQEITKYPPIIIEGFSDGKRTYGGVRCYRAKMNDTIDGAILIPERTHHDDSILEFISPVKIMDLGIKHGDKVSIKVNIEE